MITFICFISVVWYEITRVGHWIFANLGFGMDLTNNDMPRDEIVVKKKEMKNRICVISIICLISLSFNAFGKDYYVSPKGDDNNSGTSPHLPWRTIEKVNAFHFSPGDVVRFHRGAIWTGELLIRNSGLHGNPIVFTAYGTGEKPIIQNPGTWTFSIKIDADYVVVEKFLIRDSHQAGIIITENSQHNIVRGCEFTNMGAGVEINGRFNLITRNEVHDMKMVVNDPGGDNDYGANGFMVTGPNNEISYNRGWNLIDRSFDYGKDGGFVELHGKVNSSSIHHNWAENSDGFAEVGGKSKSSAKNVRIYYNVSLNNNGKFVMLHIYSQFPDNIHDFRVENNTVVDVKEYGSVSYAAVDFSGSPPPGAFAFINNILMLGRFQYFSNVSFPRRNNLYYFLDRKTRLEKSGGRLGPGEIMADPKFVNLQMYDFHLNKESPAIDKGLGLEFTIDFDDRHVPYGITTDIGAFEYSGIGNSTPLPPLPPAK